MSILVTSLLDGSGVSAESNPLLVELLEVAARRPGLAGFPEADKVRFKRRWAAVEAAFGECVAAGVTDEDLVKGSPFAGLVYNRGAGPESPVWLVSQDESPGFARDAVVEALKTVALGKPVRIREFDFSDVRGLRVAQKANRYRSFTLPLWQDGPEARIETGLLKNLRLMVSWPFFGGRLYATLQADRTGKMEAVCVSHRKTVCAEALN